MALASSPSLDTFPPWRRPFLLPCLAVATLGLVAFLCNALLLLETHPGVVSCSGGWCGNLMRVLCCRSTPPGGVAEGEPPLLSLYLGVLALPPNPSSITGSWEIGAFFFRLALKLAISTRIANACSPLLAY